MQTVNFKPCVQVCNFATIQKRTYLDLYVQISLSVIILNANQ